MDGERYHTFVEEEPWTGKLEAEIVKEEDPSYPSRLNADVSVPRLTLSLEGQDVEATYRWADRDGEPHGLEKTFTYEGEVFDLTELFAPDVWGCRLRSYVSSWSRGETVHAYTASASRRDDTVLDADLITTEDGYRFEGRIRRMVALGDVQSIIEAETGIDVFEELPYNAGDDW